LTRRSIDRQLIGVMSVIVLLAGGLGAWAMTTELAGGRCHG
jgi:hypothetical protein